MEPAKTAPPPSGRVTVPTGVAAFPKEMTVLAPPRSALERAFNLVHYTTMPRGGHFAAWEQPVLIRRRRPQILHITGGEPSCGSAGLGEKKERKEKKNQEEEKEKKRGKKKGEKKGREKEEKGGEKKKGKKRGGRKERKEEGGKGEEREEGYCTLQLKFAASFVLPDPL